MGTNFYAVKLMPTSCNCSNCDQIHYQEQKFHIGKSSGGWVFAVHAEEELNLMTWEAWKDFLFCGHYERIEDEYGYDQTPEQMVDWVESRSWPGGLLRSHSDPRCIAQGSGTWEVFRGEFS